jgi:thioredoxin reductase
MTDERLPADAVFIYIGAVPHTENFRDVLPADERGFLLLLRTHA